MASPCSGLILGGADANDYSIVYTTPANDFTVVPIPVAVAVSGTQTYGGTPTFSGNDNPPSGVTVDTSGLVCTIAGIKSIGPTTPAGSYTLAPAGCSGVTLSGGNATGYAVVYTTATGDFAGRAGPADDHGVEQLHDLRRHTRPPSPLVTRAS